MISGVQSLKKNFSNLLRKPIEINGRKLLNRGVFAISAIGLSGCLNERGEIQPIPLPKIEITSNSPPPSTPAPTAAATPAPQQQRVATVNQQPSGTPTRPTPYPSQSQQTYQSGAQPMPSSSNMGANSPEMYGRTSTPATRGNNSPVVIDTSPVSRTLTTNRPCRIPIPRFLGTYKKSTLPGGIQENRQLYYVQSEEEFTTTTLELISNEYRSTDPNWYIHSDVSATLSEQALFFNDKVGLNPRFVTQMEQSFQCSSNKSQVSTGIITVTGWRLGEPLGLFSAPTLYTNYDFKVKN